MLTFDERVNSHFFVNALKVFLRNTFDVDDFAGVRLLLFFVIRQIGFDDFSIHTFAQQSVKVY